MSGGYFDYNSARISQFAEDLQHEIDLNNDPTLNQYQEMRGFDFNEETLSRIKKIHRIIKLAGKLTREAEWLYSGDHGEESFNKLIDRILNENKKKKRSYKGFQNV